MSSSLTSPHGNSRSSSENCSSRRRQRQQLLQSFPGRRLYSTSLASPRPGCSRRTRRHLGRATSASPRDVRSYWRAQEPPASRDCLHSAGAQASGDGRPVGQSAPAARPLGLGAQGAVGPRVEKRIRNAKLAGAPKRTPAGSARLPLHAWSGRAWGEERPAEAEPSADGRVELARLGDGAAEVQWKNFPLAFPWFPRRPKERVGDFGCFCGLGLKYTLKLLPAPSLSLLNFDGNFSLPLPILSEFSAGVRGTLWN